jgi:hypothetical protein
MGSARKFPGRREFSVLLEENVDILVRHQSAFGSGKRGKSFGNEAYSGYYRRR